MLDALGNEIIIGKHYAYTQPVKIVIGKVTEIKEFKAILGNIHERCLVGIYNNKLPSEVPTEFKPATNKRRTVETCNLFPVETLAEQRDRKIDEILN